MTDCLKRPSSYLQQLLHISSCAPSSPQEFPPALMEIQSPLILSSWVKPLDNHPDKAFTEFILHGIQFGPRVGYDYNHQHAMKSKHRNLLSTLDHPAVVKAYIGNELTMSHLTHIENPGILPWFHSSLIGIIPKKHKPGKWRMIIDLSSPECHSVNDGIEKALCSLSYTSVDNVANTILELGPGTQLGKMDVKKAFRIVPIHPYDRLLMAIQWEGRLYIDKVLPFGLRSAPLLFTTLVDAAEWVIHQKGVTHVWHYVDDFIFVGEPHSDQCTTSMAAALQTFIELGIPIEPEKSEGPATSLSTLGIEVDTIAMHLRLPADKLCRLQKNKNLAWPQVLYQTRTSISNWFITTCSYSHKTRAIICPQKVKNPDHEVTSDASGSWGCGAFHAGLWFQLQWGSSTALAHIAIKELLPIVTAAMLWGYKWKGKMVRALCDNMAIVHVLHSRQSKDSELMHLLQCLSLVECYFDFILVSKHLSGKQNLLADALSCDKLPLFHAHYPQAHPNPTQIPSTFLQLLVEQKPDWICTSWASLFRAITFKA